MFVVTFILFILATQALLTIHAQDCPLTRADLESRNHVFFVNNVLLRQTVLPSGSHLQLACRNNIVTDHVCQNGILNPPLPATNCADRLRPEIVRGQAPDCLAPDILYTVRFVINGLGTELYRSCYNPTKMQVKYVEHSVYNNPFATNRPDATFTLDGVINGAQGATIASKNVYYRFIELLGVSQGYVEGTWDEAINRGHLAPSGDFLFIENKRATFKYINIMPQFARLNNGNWKKIEGYVQGLINNPVTVRTGAIGVLQLPHSDDPTKLVPMYLGDNQQNPIPMWTYKVVNNDAFLTYNNPFATDPPSSIPCPEVNCPSIGLVADFRLGYTYCCTANSLNTVVNG